MCCFFFFNDTATTEIYTLSLHDALPISPMSSRYPSGLSERLQTVETEPLVDLVRELASERADGFSLGVAERDSSSYRSEEHTSELQSQSNLVCRLLLEKKKPARQTSTDLQATTRPARPGTIVP